MRLLVLGGTAFVGRYIVEEAVAAGHDVTLFNRGQTNAELFPELERRNGDRASGDLASLKTGEWDAVIDVTAYVPRQVRQLTEAVAGRVGAYCLISTVSVYSDTVALGGDEDGPLAEHPDPASEEKPEQFYGPLKVLCEREASTAFPDALIIRPGVVAGPYDGSERFAYWVRRAARGGHMLGPPRPDQPVQVVHAGDQARFIVERVAAGGGGVFDTVGESVPFSTLLDACAKAAGADITVTWAPQQLLRDNQVALPLALPASGRWDGAFSRSGRRAAEAGFVNRPLVDTATETLAWDRTRDPVTFRGLSASEEAALLAAV